MTTENAVISLCGIVVPCVLVFGLIKYSKYKLLKKYGVKLDEYNNLAYVEDLTPYEGRDDLIIVMTLVREMVAEKGQLAVIIKCANSGSLAIQHINKNGSFSKKTPYYISKRSNNWSLTGRRHLVKLIRYRYGMGMQSSNPSQGNGIMEIGMSIAEFDTSKYYKVDIYNFVELIKENG